MTILATQDVRDITLSDLGSYFGIHSNCLEFFVYYTVFLVMGDLVYHYTSPGHN